MREQAVFPDQLRTGFSSEIGTKLRESAVGQVGGSCFSQAALSSNDSKTLYEGHIMDMDKSWTNSGGPTLTWSTKWANTAEEGSGSRATVKGKEGRGLLKVSEYVSEHSHGPLLHGKVNEKVRNNSGSAQRERDGTREK